MNASTTRVAQLATAAFLGALMMFVAQYAVAHWGGGPSGPPAGNDIVLATVDGQPITAAAFEREMQRRGGVASFPQRVQRRGLLDDMVRHAVWVANARRAGYDHDPDVRREMGYILSGKYQKEHVEGELTDVKVSEQEIRAYYDAHPERFTIPEAAHAALIFFAIESSDFPERRQKIADRAAEVRAAAEKQDPTGHFGALAVENSSDQASRYRGGDIGWIPRGQTDSRWEPAVLDAIFALDAPGALSPLITTEKGIYLIRLLDRKPASLKPLNDVAGAIHRELQSEKRQQRSDELYAAAAAAVEVQVNAERLAEIKVPEVGVVENRPGPPPVPQG